MSNDSCEVEEIDNYEVEEIVKKKLIDGEFYYLLKWAGYKEKTWEPRENLNCEELLEKFESSLCESQDVLPDHNDKEVLDLFYTFMYDRHNRWFHRETKAEEDKSNSILCSYRFTNMYRELDTGTLYFQAQVKQKKEQNENFCIANYIRMSIAYRIVNKVATFQRFGGIPSTPEEVKIFVSFMKKQQIERIICFTNCHQTGGFSSFYRTMASLEGKMGGMVEALKNGLKAFSKEVMKVIFIGKFFAQQITSDMEECGFGDGSDSWIILGPGAIIGLRILFPNVTGPAEIMEKAKWLQKNQDEAFKELGVNFQYWKGERLSLKNIEHALCEFQKYYSIKIGKSISKQRRKGPRGKKRAKRKNVDDSEEDWDEEWEEEYYEKKKVKCQPSRARSTRTKRIRKATNEIEAETINLLSDEELEEREGEIN